MTFNLLLCCINSLVMERCLFLKDVKGYLTIRVSENLYEEILCYMEHSGQPVSEYMKSAGMESKELLVLNSVCNPGLQCCPKDMDSIFVKDKDYYRRIEFKYIRWIEASGSYCYLYLDNEPKLILAFNLRELSSHLPPQFFVRVHRSYIVNVNFIDSFIGNMLYIGKNQIPISRQSKPVVLSRLNILGTVK